MDQRVRRSFGDGPEPPMWMLILYSRLFWWGFACGTMAQALFTIVMIIVIRIVRGG